MRWTRAAIPILVATFAASTPYAAASPEASPDGGPVAGDDELLPWRSREIDPRYETDFSAYTIGARRVRIGLFNIDVGLLRNVQLGTAPLLWPFGVPNIHGKVTAIQTRVFDASFQAAWTGIAGTARDDGARSYFVSSIPLTLMFSFVVSKHVGIHVGWRWDNVSVRGEFDVGALTSSLLTSLGFDATEVLGDVVGDMGALYGGARMTLGTFRLATDLRFSRRDSLIVQYQTPTTLNGRLDAGYENPDETVAVGAAARFTTPPEDLFGGTLTVSWQFTWEHFRLRLGIPIPISRSPPLYYLDQAFALYWLF